MSRAFVRISALVALVALSACAGGSIQPGSSAMPAVPVAPALTAAKASPCDIAGDWYFTGACTRVEVGSAGLTVKLPAYKGIAAKFAFSSNNATGKIPFIVGDGTSDTDIVGKLDNKYKFPVYGSIKCESTNGVGAPCPGKAFLYLEVFDAGKESVVFTKSPGIVVSDKHFPGTHCQLDALTLNSANKFVWELLPIYAAPKGGTATYAAQTFSITLSGQTFIDFALTCH
jgi:hypothetical protein